MSAERKALAVLAAACSVGFGYMSLWEGRKYSKLSSKFNQVRGEIEKFKPVELEGPDAAVYPWYRNNNLEEEWEYKLVKITGYFREERFFIAREREGKKGYLVMAPFITSYQKYPKFFKPSDVNRPLESGLMVNLGWVPAENKDDIELSSEPLPLLVTFNFFPFHELENHRTPPKKALSLRKIDSQVISFNNWPKIPLIHRIGQ